MQRPWNALTFDVRIPVVLERTENGDFICYSPLFGHELTATAESPEDAVSSYYVRLRVAFDENAATEQAFGHAFLQALFTAGAEVNEALLAQQADESSSQPAALPAVEEPSAATNPQLPATPSS